MLRIYFGHHRSGSTWIKGILNEIARAMGLRSRTVIDRGALPPEILDGIRTGRFDLLNCINADPAHLSGLPGFRAFHVVRDPRDLLVSAYFSHRYSHPTSQWPALAEQRARLESMTIEEGLLAELEFNAPVFRTMGDWNYGHAGIREIRFEDLIHDPYSGFADILHHLGLLRNEEGRSHAGHMIRRLAFLIHESWNRASRRFFGTDVRLFPARRIPVERLLGIVHAHRFERKARGRARGEEDVHSHYRIGVPGSWAQHFTPAVRTAFKAEHGELLIRLGYEADHDW